MYSFKAYLFSTPRVGNDLQLIMQSLSIFSRLEYLFLQFMFYMILFRVFNFLNSQTKTSPNLMFASRVREFRIGQSNLKWHHNL